MRAHSLLRKQAHSCADLRPIRVANGLPPRESAQCQIIMSEKSAGLPEPDVYTAAGVVGRLMDRMGGVRPAPRAAASRGDGFNPREPSSISRETLASGSLGQSLEEEIRRLFVSDRLLW